MSSVIKGCGGKSPYQDLPKLTEEIKKHKNLVLLVIDGMGKDHLPKLLKKNKKSFLANHFYCDLTSVFPTTTTAAITTFFTGKAPQEHGLAAWDMYFDEIKDIGTILPNIDRLGNKIPKGKITYPSSLLLKIDRKRHIIQHQDIIDSGYNDTYSTKATKWRIRTFNGILNKITLALKKGANKKFIYCYWGDLDGYSHHFGKDGTKTQKHLKYLDRSLGKFFSHFKKEDTLFLITADHGHINVPKGRGIALNKFPSLIECLKTPPAGEPRALFCYVKSNKKKQFETFVRNKLSKYCTLNTAKELVKKGYFGTGKTHPKLLSRLGDYVLVMKSNYIFKYFENREPHFHIGNHGGISVEEMTVPLIMFKRK